MQDSIYSSNVEEGNVEQYFLKKDFFKEEYTSYARIDEFLPLSTILLRFSIILPPLVLIAMIPIYFIINIFYVIMFVVFQFYIAIIIFICFCMKKIIDRKNLSIVSLSVLILNPLTCFFILFNVILPLKPSIHLFYSEISAGLFFIVSLFPLKSKRIKIIIFILFAISFLIVIHTPFYIFKVPFEKLGLIYYIVNPVLLMFTMFISLVASFDNFIDRFMFNSMFCVGYVTCILCLFINMNSGLLMPGLIPNQP